MNARAESSFTCRIQHFNNNNDNKTYKKENKKPHSQILASRRAHPKKNLPARSPAAIPTKKLCNTGKIHTYHGVFYCKEYIHQDQSLCTNYHCTYPQKNRKQKP